MNPRRPEVHALDLQIAPDWEAVKTAWDACREVLARAGLSDDETYQLAMVAQELLENAVKFGVFEAGEHIQLGIRAVAEDVVVEVKNRVGVDDAHLRRFDRTIQWIRGYQNPFEAFVEKMKSVSAQASSAGETGLGLTRVAYEGRSILDFYLDEDDLLAVSAVYRREIPGGVWRTP